MDLKWFDGYSGQQNAIIDDFREDFCSFSFLLRVLDRYPLKVAVKGSFVEWNPTTIYITCPHSPAELYAYKTPADLAQLTRRITTIRRFQDIIVL